MDLIPLLEQEEFCEDRGHVCVIGTVEGRCCTAPLMYGVHSIGLYLYG